MGAVAVAACFRVRAGAPERVAVSQAPPAGADEEIRTEVEQNLGNGFRMKNQAKSATRRSLSG